MTKHPLTIGCVLLIGSSLASCGGEATRDSPPHTSGSGGSGGSGDRGGTGGVSTSTGASSYGYAGTGAQPSAPGTGGDIYVGDGGSAGANNDWIGIK